MQDSYAEFVVEWYNAVNGHMCMRSWTTSAFKSGGDGDCRGVVVPLPRTAIAGRSQRGDGAGCGGCSGTATEQISRNPYRHSGGRRYCSKLCMCASVQFHAVQRARSGVI